METTTAVAQIPVPSDVAGIQQFMGMVNHLGKFIPHLADLSDPSSIIKTVFGFGANPSKKSIKQALVSPLQYLYWENRSHLTILDDLHLYDDRILVPRSMRLKILDCIHTGRLGLTKC